MQLTDHFSLEEMVSSETASRWGIPNTPNDEVIANLHRLCVVLEDIRSMLGVQMHITSGYRSSALNRVIGGSTYSAHMQGLAADFIAPPHIPLDVCDLIVGSGIDFDQVIYEYTWCHFGLSTIQNRKQVLTCQGAGYVPGLPDQQ